MNTLLRIAVMALALIASCAHAEDMAVDMAASDDLERILEVLTAERESPAGSWTIGAGVDFSRGRYGAREATEVLYYPFDITYRRGRWTFAVDSGVLKVRGPVDYAAILDLTPAEIDALGLDTSPISASGIGDLYLSTRFAAFEKFESGTFIDVGARLKVPTASRTKGLGNGNVGGELQLDLTQLVGRWTLFASASYGFRDHSNGDRDTQSFAVGVGYPLTDKLSAGIAYDWRRSPRAGGINGQQVMGYGAFDLTSRVSITVYNGYGLTAADPDVSVGLRLSLRFQA